MGSQDSERGALLSLHPKVSEVVEQGLDSREELTTFRLVR